MMKVNEWTLNGEQRMRLRLSPLAAAVLEEDRLAFHAKSPSQLVCTVFENHHAGSPASIGRTLAGRQQALTELLGDALAVKRLIRREEQELITRCQWEKGDDLLPIRVQKRAKELLLSCETLEGKYYSKSGSYFRAVLEDYCRLTPTQRQRVYFAQRFELVEYAILQGRQLRVVTESDNVFLVHPYSLETDKLVSNWYLAGYSRREGEGVREKQPASFRMATLKSVTVMGDKASIPAEQRRELERLILNQGVQFLLEKPCRILVRMTDHGIKRYNRMPSLRPACQRINGEEWEFYCTLLQAKRYFMRLGAGCKVISPPELREELAKEFASAAEIYK